MNQSFDDSKQCARIIPLSHLKEKREAHLLRGIDLTYHQIRCNLTSQVMLWKRLLERHFKSIMNANQLLGTQ